MHANAHIRHTLTYLYLCPLTADDVYQCAPTLRMRRLRQLYLLCRAALHEDRPRPRPFITQNKQTNTIEYYI